MAKNTVNLRKAARGKPCMVRIPGVCCGDPETTVLAHLPMAGISGIGMKCPDIIGTWACYACHELIDNKRGSEYSRLDVRLFSYDGLRRTLNELVTMGVL